MPDNTAPTPQRQIRAVFDEASITLYQAYQPSIAVAAAESQKLDASPDFSLTRMTWVKPSWNWMMYRSGYAAKDARQARILALKVSHHGFRELLSSASVTSHAGTGLTDAERARPVRVQWDPERTFRMGVLPHRSIQIGISARDGINKRWIDEWITEITDVTGRAKELKQCLDDEPGIEEEELLRRGLVPVERVYELPADLMRALGMDD